MIEKKYCVFGDEYCVYSEMLPGFRRVILLRVAEILYIYVGKFCIGPVLHGDLHLCYKHSITKKPGAHTGLGSGVHVTKHDL